MKKEVHLNLGEGIIRIFKKRLCCDLTEHGPCGPHPSPPPPPTIQRFEGRDVLFAHKKY